MNKQLTKGWRPAAAVAAGVTIALWAALSWEFAGDALVGNALGPVALFPQAAPDDGAGDGTVPAAEAEFYLPVPAALEDERVIAAMGPIAHLTCTPSDYATPAAGAALPPEAAAAASDGDNWLDAGATHAAMAPLTDVTKMPDESPAAAQYASAETAARERALSAPMAPSASAVDALLTQHLLGAALSPLAALHAPEDETPATTVAVATAPAAGGCPPLLQYTFNRLQTGEAQTLCQFQGKVLLIVNTASYCGNTPQYEGLEALYRTYKGRGLVVVGFPSNDFGGQEPGSNKDIAEFCRTTYGVAFPMFEKSSVTRVNANPLFVDLTSRTGSAPRWNFHKYVVDRTGTRVTSFSDRVQPDARDLVDLVERLLSETPAAKG